MTGQILRQYNPLLPPQFAYDRQAEDNSPSSGIRIGGRSAYMSCDSPPMIPRPRQSRSQDHVYDFSASGARYYQDRYRPASHISIHERRLPTDAAL
eukprot:9519391-Karenia_brevis.AAC.1